jgi:hypothetical protein
MFAAPCVGGPGYSANRLRQAQRAQPAWDSLGETASKELRWLLSTTLLEDEAPPTPTCKPA